LPPNSDLTAEQFLLEVNTPGSKLSHLFPKTLARVPGLGDPQFNASNNKLHPIRLPPPIDTAIGLRLPAPHVEKVHVAEMEDHLQHELPRVKADEQHGKEAIAEGRQVGEALVEANKRFEMSATSYAFKLRNHAMPPPWIPSWFDLQARRKTPDGESPYGSSWWSFWQKSTGEHRKATQQPPREARRPSSRFRAVREQH